MYKIFQLSNGIRVVTEKADYMKSVSAGVWVGAGSAVENKSNNGVSHFIEHMLFKGTKTRNAVQIARYMEDVGGQLNALTEREYTCYYTRTLSEHIDMAVDILSDMICNSTFASENIETERMVISEEINMYEDTPEDVVHDLLSASLWGETPLGLPVAGSCASVAKLSRRDMLDYMDTLYCAENMVLSVAGCFDEVRVMELLEEKFGGIRKCGALPLRQIYTPVVRGFKSEKRSIEQCHVCMGFQGIDRRDEQFYDLLIVDALFGGNMSSRLFQKVREEAGLAYSIYTDVNTHVNNGSFVIYAGLNPKGSERAFKIINDEIKRLKSEKFGVDEIETAKIQLKASVIMEDENMYSRMGGYARGTLFDNEIETTEDVIAQIERINHDSVARIIERVFDINTFNIAMHGKIKGNAKRFEEIMDF